MKSVLIVLLGLVSASAFANETPKCTSKITKPALQRINRIYSGDSAETRTIEGVKAIHVGDFIETYAIAASDEVEPSEWIAIVKKSDCKIKFIDVAKDGSWSELFDN